MNFSGKYILILAGALLLSSVSHGVVRANPTTFAEFATSDALKDSQRKTLQALFARARIDVQRGITEEAAIQLENKILRGTGLAFGGSDKHELMSGQINALWSADITDISLIIYFPHLTRIDLDNNEDVDLTPLLKMPNLKGLSFRGVKSVDLRFVAQLKSLSYLDLRQSGVTDISPLSSLKTLKQLGISDTAVTRISVLGAHILSNLSVLEAENVALTDWECLSACRGLEYFMARRSNISDLSPLGNSHSLEFVNVSGAKNVRSLTSLAGLKKLKSLSISKTAINDLSPLAQAASLERLYAEETTIFDLRPLAGLTALRELVIPKSKVKDLRPLANMKNLELLDIQDTPLLDDDLRILDPLLRDHRNDNGDLIQLTIRFWKHSGGGLGIENE